MGNDVALKFYFIFLCILMAVTVAYIVYIKIKKDENWFAFLTIVDLEASIIAMILIAAHPGDFRYIIGFAILVALIFAITIGGQAKRGTSSSY